jgi:hypothetical protein
LRFFTQIYENMFNLKLIQSIIDAIVIITTFLVFYYVDGKDVSKGFLEDFPNFKTMLYPLSISLLVGTVVFLYFSFKNTLEAKEQKMNFQMKEMGDAILHLNRVVKDAYIQAWVSGHFDIVGNWKTPKGERPITYKYYDSQIFKDEGMMIKEPDFLKMVKWLEDRYDLKHKLTDEDRLIFQVDCMKAIMRNE